MLMEILAIMGKMSPAAPGQQVFAAGTTWTVPAGVTAISMVCMQQGGDASATGTEVVVGGSTVCRAKNGARIGDGGGDGGSGAPLYDWGDGTYSGGGGGGAGGYSGNGGNGGSAPTAGTGGAGGGGAGPWSYGAAGGPGGGGVGLLGQGASGNGGVNNVVVATGGGGGSGGGNGADMSGAPGQPGGAYGGGAGGVGGSFSGANGVSGGALSYKNNVAVTPGSSVTITIPATAGANGAVRIMWGGGRSYPNNAGDM